MKKCIFMILLIAGLALVTQAQTGLFIDYTQSGWNLNVNNVTPNSSYTFTMIQSAGSGTITFSLAENGTYSNPLDISIITDGSGNGSTPFWVKGTALGPATWQVCQQGPTNCTGGATISFSVVTISSLEFVDLDSPVVNNDNPNTGDGKRIYPDKTSASDSVNRKRVRVKATLSAAMNNMSVYFKSFDLDDPTSNLSPVDSNGSSGGDNRATLNGSGILAPANQSGSSNTLTLVTSPQGVAEADLTVTMHPGDNFMAAASGDPNVVSGIQIDGITLKDAGNNTLPVTKAKNTPMLTVWRKLNIEVDNMGSIGTNHQAGTVASASVSGGQTTMVLTAGQTLENNRYSVWINGATTNIQGKMKFSNKTYDVYTNSTTQVVVDEVINPLSKVVGKAFTIYDDDNYNGTGTAWNGDEDETTIASLSSFTKLQQTDSSSTNVYAPAYIMPVYNTTPSTFNGSANEN